MWSSCHKHRTKKKSESPTGIEPMTFRTPVRCPIILYLLNRSKSKWMFVVWNFNIPWRAASHYQTSQVSRFLGKSHGLMMRHKNLTVNRFTSWWNTLFEYVHFCLVKLICRRHFCRNPQFWGIFVIFDHLVDKGMDLKTIFRRQMPNKVVITSLSHLGTFRPHLSKWLKRMNIENKVQNRMERFISC